MADAMLSRLGHLKVYRAKGGPAPHKPLLLLVLLYLYDHEPFKTPVVELTPSLAFHFETFWSVVAHRRNQRGDIRLPFFHLRSDGFWQVFDAAGAPAQHRNTAAYAVMSDELFSLLIDPEFRRAAMAALIRTYFRPEERSQLCDLVSLPADVVRDLGSDVPIPSRTRTTGREAKFRLDVVVAYDYACALTGYRITTIGLGTLVDAAHIHAFSDSRSNDPRNGISLSKNAHWMFDAGLWSLTDDYRVIVARGHFAESCPNQRPLLEFEGESLRLPAKQEAWPDPTYLRWHRQRRFVSGEHP